MTDLVSDIVDFNEIVLGIAQRKPTLLSTNEYQISVNCLNEEIKEFNHAHINDDLVGCIDAMIDNLYFTVGVLYKLGLNPDQIKQCFAAVHLANMTKNKGENAKRATGAADAVKPEGWVGPEEMIKEILNG